MLSVLIYGSINKWGYSDIANAVRASPWDEEDITHIVVRNSLGYGNMELWAVNNGKVVKKFNPSSSLIKELGWEGACRKHNRVLVENSDAIILLYSPSSPSYNALVQTIEDMKEEKNTPVYCYTGDNNIRKAA